MSHGLLAGMFSQHNAQAPFHPVGIETLAEAPTEPEADRSFEYALDALPCNAMFCDRELILRYLNRSSRKTLLTLQQYLPVPVDQMVGKSIHIFHRNPANIDRILGAKSPAARINCPTRRPSSWVPVKLDLDVEPMTGEHGEFVGAVVVWGISTQQTIDALEGGAGGRSATTSSI